MPRSPAKYHFRGTVLSQPSLLQQWYWRHLPTNTSFTKTSSLSSKDCTYGYMSSCLARARPRVISLMNQRAFFLLSKRFLLFFNPKCAKAQVSTQWTWQSLKLLFLHPICRAKSLSMTLTSGTDLPPPGSHGRWGSFILTFTSIYSWGYDPVGQVSSRD